MQFPNWFGHYADGFFERHLTGLAGQSDLRFLQVGAFTGDATMWLLTHILTGPGSTLTDVDTWRGSDEPEHEPFDFVEVERTYDARTVALRASGRLVKFKGSSETFFRSEPETLFDFVYIDGDHTAAAVLSDGMHAYRMLKPGGLLAFDDYLWKSGKGAEYDPGPAIDVISGTLYGRLEKLEQGLQVWFRRAA